MKKNLILLSALILTNCFSKKEEHTISMSYEKYLEYNGSCARGHELANNGKLEAAKAEYYKCAQLVEYETTGYAGLAECFAQSNQCDSAMLYVQKAYEGGLPWRNIDTLLFDTHKLQKLYDSSRAIYFSKVDTALRAILQEMVRNDQKYRLTPNYIYNDSLVRLQAPIDSINRQSFDQIIITKGWPGNRLLGFGILPNIKIVAMHSDHANTLRYLNIAMEAARKNQTSWRDAEGLMDMLLFKFERKEGLNKLRFVFLDDNGSLDIKRSLFQLNCLARLKTYNPYPIELFPTHSEEIPSIDPTKALLEIKNFLVNQGVPGSIIFIDDHWQQVEDDKLGKFMFGFRTLNN